MYDPISWADINNVTGHVDPSTVHTDSVLQNYFMHYLLMDVFSIYEWSGIPDSWNMDFFRFVLFMAGYVGILNTDRYGVIPQICRAYGIGVYYQPIRALFSNPIFAENYDLAIDKNCTIIKLQPDYTGIMNLVSFYADMMALSAESAGVNLQNTKLAYLFMSSNKQEAESWKKIMDQILAGNPAAYADEKLFDREGNPKYVLFNNNLQQTYIAGDILEDMRKWKLMFNEDVGIPTVHTDKKERLTTDEVNSNNTENRSKCEVWLETLQEGVKKTNELFNLNISVKLRWEADYGNNVNPGIVPDQRQPV